MIPVKMFTLNPSGNIGISPENLRVPYELDADSSLALTGDHATPEGDNFLRYGGVSGAGKMTESGYRSENAKHLDNLTTVIAGRREGRDPMALPLSVLVSAGHGPRRTCQVVAAMVDIPLVEGVRRYKDLRRHCLKCAENRPEVRRCATIDCPAWPYRTGRNPHNPRRGKNPFLRQTRDSSAVAIPPEDSRARPKPNSPGEVEQRTEKSELGSVSCSSGTVCHRFSSEFRG